MYQYNIPLIFCVECVGFKMVTDKKTIATSTSTQNVLSTSDGKIKPLQSRFNTSLTNINRNEGIAHII